MCDDGATKWCTSLPDECMSSIPTRSCPNAQSLFLPCLNALHRRFGGVISQFSQTSGEHLVIYDDGEQKWHDLDEGVATMALRWPGNDILGAGEDEGPVTPKAPVMPVERVESVSPRPPEPPQQTDGSPAMVCDYCSSKGRVHRKCLRLESCAVIWKRNGTSKARRDAEEGNVGSSRTLSTLELVRSRRAPALPPEKRAQVLSARTPNASPIPHRPTADANEWQYAPTPSSEMWLFPVIVPPEALGWNISKDGTIMRISDEDDPASAAEL